MNRAYRVLALLGLVAAATARAGMDVTWTFVNFTSDPQTVKAVKVTPLAPWGTNAAGIVTGDYKQRQTLNTGAVTITNMTAGYAYRVTFTGSFVETAFTNYFPPGLTGAVNATYYLTPTNPAAFIPYSVSQADAKFQVKSNANFTGTLTWNGIPLSTNADTSSGGGTIVSSNDNTIIVTPTEVAPGVTNFGVAGNTSVLATKNDVTGSTTAEAAARIAGDRDVVRYSIITNFALLTNSMSSTGATIASYNAANWTWSNNAYRSGVRYVTNKSWGWAAEQAISPNLYTNASSDPTAAYTPFATNGNPPDFFWNIPTGTFTTNVYSAGATNPFAMTDTVSPLINNSVFSLYAVGFDNGRVSPTYANSKQKGMAMFSRDGRYWSGKGVVIEGQAGSVRDPATIKANGHFYTSYTTNIDAVTSLAFSVEETRDLQNFTLATNISPTFPGETFPATNTAVWGAFPVVFPVAANSNRIRMFVGVNTNFYNSGKFNIRVSECAEQDYPYGLTYWTNMNTTLADNIIDASPYYDAQTDSIWVWWKNESNKVVNLARAQSKNLNAVVSASGVPFGGDVLGVWRSGVEAPWMVRLPNGKYRCAVYRYLGSPYDRRYYSFDTYTTNLTDDLAWYSGQPVQMYLQQFEAGEIQNFKPLVLTNAQDLALASAAASAGRVNDGMLIVWGRYYSQFPLNSVDGSGEIRGLSTMTNDYQVILLGTLSYPGTAIWVGTNGVAHFVTASTNQSDSSLPVFPSYAKEVFTISNGVFALDPSAVGYGNGGGFTNLNASGLSSGTVPAVRLATTNPVVSLTNSYALVMQGTNPPAYVTVVSNFTASGFTVTTNINTSGIALTVNGTLIMNGRFNLNNNEIYNGGGILISPNGVSSAWVFQNSELYPNSARDHNIGRLTTPMGNMYGTGVTYSSNTLTMAQAAGLVTNGYSWIGRISNSLYAVGMSNNVATFTNLSITFGIP